MKFVSCSVCFKLVAPKKTTVVEHKRICHECKSEQKKKAASF